MVVAGGGIVDGGGVVTGGGVVALRGLGRQRRSANRPIRLSLE
jgi:hypothetical protein